MHSYLNTIALIVVRYPNTIAAILIQYRPQKRPELFAQYPNMIAHRFYAFFTPFLYILLLALSVLVSFIMSDLMMLCDRKVSR